MRLILPTVQCLTKQARYLMSMECLYPLQCRPCLPLSLPARIFFPPHRTSTIPSFESNVSNCSFPPYAIMRRTCTGEARAGSNSAAPLILRVFDKILTTVSPPHPFFSCLCRTLLSPLVIRFLGFFFFFLCWSLKRIASPLRPS